MKPDYLPGPGGSIHAVLIINSVVIDRTRHSGSVCPGKAGSIANRCIWPTTGIAPANIVTNKGCAAVIAAIDPGNLVSGSGSFELDLTRR